MTGVYTVKRAVFRIEDHYTVMHTQTGLRRRSIIDLPTFALTAKPEKLSLELWLHLQCTERNHEPTDNSSAAGTSTEHTKARIVYRAV
jgi:hypothetical protein